MLDWIINLSVNRPGVVLLFVVLIGCLGAWNFGRLPIDAVPDITNVQVVVNTAAPGYTPLEVEQRVSFVVENAMAGIPRRPHALGIALRAFAGHRRLRGRNRHLLRAPAGGRAAQ